MTDRPEDMATVTGGSSLRAPPRAETPSRTDFWPGFDRDFFQRVRKFARTRTGSSFRRRLTTVMDARRARARSWPMGPPCRIEGTHASTLHRLVGAYVRCIDSIIRMWASDARLRSVVLVPEELVVDARGGSTAANARVHLCRLDMMLDASGRASILETNANCPGALYSSGLATRLWREFLAAEGVALPAPLDHEGPAWTARWYTDVARVETGVVPTLVPLLREEGGNRGELPGIREQLEVAGIESFEADPREITLGRGGAPYLRGRSISHAYLKVGMAALARMRSELEPFFRSVLQGRLFVQNGIRGRLVGDNKLCLAVLSDPSFQDLFDRRDLDVVRDCIPWSRNVRLCSSRELEAIRSDRRAFVLKRPLDTRGQGVVVGREVRAQTMWNHALSVAKREGWLVQRFCGSTKIETGFSGDAVETHDLCVGAVNGRLVGALLRSGPGARLNIAVNGRLHQTFLDGDPADAAG